MLAIGTRCDLLKDILFCYIDEVLLNEIRNCKQKKAEMISSKIGHVPGSYHSS